MIRKVFIAVLGLGLMAGLQFGGAGGCGSGGGDTSGTETFEGGVALASGQTGTIVINIPDDADVGLLSARAQTSSDVSITGQCIYPDNTVSLDGSLDGATGDFTLEGGACTFTGNLNLDDGTFTGSVSCEDLGDGSISGVDSSEVDVQVFCGTYEDNLEGGTATGFWVVTASGTTASGNYAGTDGSGSLVGTREGNTITITVPEETSGGYAQGTISGNSVTGTIYGNGGPASGSFQGSTDDCSL